MPRKIVIDTDPGQDDAVAILLAFASPEVEVLGITAVAGNVPLALTSRNIRVVCEVANRRQTLCFAGADRPLVRKLITAEYVHGKTGLDGADLPEPTMALQPKHAVDFLIDTVMSEPAGTITLCPLGPLTNIATAMQREPRFASRLQEIVLMGGGFFEGGNTTPAAEFNILVDPQAAAIVFGSGAPITMVPLDVTHQALTKRHRVAAIRDIGTPVATATAQWLEFFERFDISKYGSDGGPLHDPCVIAWLIEPSIFGGRQCNVEIETHSELTMGMTVVDWWGVTSRHKNAMVLRSIDADRFYALLTERIALL